MRRRTLRALLLAATALLLLPALARACNFPTLVVLPNVAGPGDPMHYTISGVTPGANWEFRVGGLEIRGQATSTIVTGSFRMPNLGDRSTGFEVSGEIEHSDIDPTASPSGNDKWPLSDTDAVYLVAAPPAQSEPAPSVPPATAPADRSPGNSISSPQPPGNAGPGRGTRQGDGPPRSPAPVPTAAPVESQPHATPAAATGEARATGAAREELHGVPVSIDRHRPGRTHPARAPVPQLAVPTPVSEAASAWPAGEPGRDRPALPLPLLLIVGLGAAGICAGWMIRLVRRGGDAAAPSVTAPVPRIPPDVALEAELQEILAEERLKRFADQHGRDVAEPGEPVRAGPG